MHSAFLFLSLLSFSLTCRFPFRLNRSFEAGFRLNAFGLGLLGLDKQSMVNFPEQGYTPEHAFGLGLLGLDKQSVVNFPEQGYKPEQVKDTPRKHQRKQSTQG
jgi:hypothetical protein